MKNCVFFLCMAYAGLLFTSCKTPRQIAYFQGSFDTTKLRTMKYVEPVAKKGDLIGILVYSDNAAASALYNQPVPGSFSDNAALTSEVTVRPDLPTYMVDDQGNIQFQQIGRLHVEGMTKRQIDSFISEKLKPTLNNPYCTVRFLNYKITVLGEVTRSGVYSIPAERVNVLEALGLAGDIAFYGRRENVLVVREVNGVREFGRIDLTSPEAFLSPWYQLQQNDVIYVEPDKKKIQANDQSTIRLISITASIISTVAILINVINK
jgi:polysaccharide biosynthesis/export protein